MLGGCEDCPDCNPSHDHRKERDSLQEGREPNDKRNTKKKMKHVIQRRIFTKGRIRESLDEDRRRVQQIIECGDKVGDIYFHKFTIPHFQSDSGAVLGE